MAQLKQATKKQSTKKQSGYTILGLILAVAIMGVITMQFTGRLEYELTAQAETATVNDMTLLAQAQLSHRWEHSDWETDIARLYPAFRNLNGVGEPYVFRDVFRDEIHDGTPGKANSPLIIETNMRSQGSARRVAQRLGSFASLAEDLETGEMTLVRAEYPVPLGTLATLNDEYLRRDGANDVIGSLHFRQGTQANLELQGNRINGASRVEIKTPKHDGLLEADLGSVDILTVRHFKYTSPGEK